MGQAAECRSVKLSVKWLAQGVALSDTTSFVYKQFR